MSCLGLAAKTESRAAAEGLAALKPLRHGPAHRGVARKRGQVVGRAFQEEEPETAFAAVVRGNGQPPELLLEGSWTSLANIIRGYSSLQVLRRLYDFLCQDIC